MCKKIHPPVSYRDDWQGIIDAEVSGHWFDQDAMSFFKSRILWSSLDFSFALDTAFFISSEDTSNPYFGEKPERRYTLRSWNGRDGVETVGEFKQFATSREAYKALRQALRACGCGDCSDTPILQRPTQEA